MSIAEKLKQIAKNQQRVYEAGYVRGRNSNAYDEGYMQCAQDVDLATQMPFFLTPFEVTRLAAGTAEKENIDVEGGVLYCRFRGVGSSREGVSVSTIAPYNNDENGISISGGKYLVFKMRTNYAKTSMDFHIKLCVKCEKEHDHATNHKRVTNTNFMPEKNEWATYIMNLEDFSDYKNEDGKYPEIMCGGFAFYTDGEYADQTIYYVDFAYSAVCAEPKQVADLIKNDTAFLWDQSNRKWTKEFDPLTDLNEQNKILEEV